MSQNRHECVIAWMSRMKWITKCLKQMPNVQNIMTIKFLHWTLVRDYHTIHPRNLDWETSEVSCLFTFCSSVRQVRTAGLHCWCSSAVPSLPVHRWTRDPSASCTESQWMQLELINSQINNSEMTSRCLTRAHVISVRTIPCDRSSCRFTDGFSGSLMTS